MTNVSISSYANIGLSFFIYSQHVGNEVESHRKTVLSQVYNSCCHRFTTAESHSANYNQEIVQFEHWSHLAHEPDFGHARVLMV